MRSRSSASPVLLLHGQPGSAQDWTRVVTALDGVRGRAAPIAIDRPGWDGATPPRDLAGNAAAALGALDARGIERAIVVGHSLGGGVAAWLAAHHPDRVSALVLAAPAANRASLEWLDRWLTLPLAGALTTAASLTGLGLALSAGPVRQRIARASALDEDYLRAAGRALLSARARRAFDTEQRALVHDLPVLEDRLSEVSAPTWILTGSADRVIPAAAPRRLADQIPGARLVVLERAGHLLPQLHARRVTEAIELALDAGLDH
ncbi:MAG: alpha/beta hydrolase [Solirubrobacteraceae bacterium]